MLARLIAGLPTASLTFYWGIAALIHGATISVLVNVFVASWALPYMQLVMVFLGIRGIAATHFAFHSFLGPRKISTLPRCTLMMESSILGLRSTVTNFSPLFFLLIFMVVLPLQVERGPSWNVAGS
jgi:hypothetical protein